MKLKTVFALMLLLPLYTMAQSVKEEAYAVFKDRTLTFYYGSNKPQGAYDVERTYDYEFSQVKNIKEWYQKWDLYTVVFDESFKKYRPKSCKSWFKDCAELKSIIGMKEYLNTENVTDMEDMFSNCQRLTSLDVSGLNTQNVTNMSNMFRDCKHITNLDISGFNTQKVTNMSNMFLGCKNLTSLDVSRFNTEKVTDMSDMFRDCQLLTSLDVKGFNTQNVTNMSNMFCNCKKLTSVNVSGFNTQNVTNMSGMFKDCSSITSIDVSGFNTEKVTDMSYMFLNCSLITSLDVSKFKTEKVTDMSYMFSACPLITSLDLSGFNTGKVAFMSCMFNGSKNLKTIYIGQGWKINKKTDGLEMFKDCINLIGGQGTKYDESKIDTQYAQIDGGKELPGYFTKK
ncbi:MAG: BspA family leucine-rich repeat surface protein [Bacteroidales bacterium]|nr:BspA family leucine-rich repeat surface protein [Bacteroidales bacterium]